MNEREHARRSLDRQRLGDRDRAVAARVEDDRLASRIELEDRSREGLARGEDVVAGIGVVAGALRDEDAVGEDGLSGRGQEEGNQKGCDGEENSAGKTHGKPPYCSLMARVAYPGPCKRAASSPGLQPDAR